MYSAGHQAGRCSVNWLRATTLSCSLLVATSCTNTGSQFGGRGTWEIDSVVSRCIASVAGGAFLGGLVGAVAGRGNGRTMGAGAFIGAAAGGVLCAVISSLDAQDRERIRQAQLESARSGQPRVLSYHGGDGLERTVSIQPRDLTPPTAPAEVRAPTNSSPSSAEIGAASGERVCRRLDTNVTVQSKGQVEIPAQLLCRTPGGDWEPVPA